jgi:Ca-activated chloride channel family protein
MRGLKHRPAIVALLALAACTPAPVSRDAPNPPAQEQASTATAATSKDLREIVVTGSRARSAGLLSSTPASYLYEPPHVDRENYGHFDPNPVHRVAEQPVSTFSVDVDTGSYTNVRRMLNEGRLPPQDSAS